MSFFVFTFRSRLTFVAFLLGIAGVFFSQDHCAADEAAQGQEFQSAVQPLLKKYCFECHAKDVTEAEIDLAAFGTIADVRKEAKTWVKVRHMLDSGQMPPKDAAQPTEEELAKLQQWVREFLTAEAKAHAGDPGPVLLRRLSNAEYAYTIRDLTGIESLDPTREFPVDGAAGEGFTNTGSGQGMSPALLRKYLNAAKEVAGHMVLLPEGVRFSPHATERDQTDELLARIQDFYRQFTEDGEGMPINLQGIQFNTNQGGLLPLQSYLAATLEEREALRTGQKTIVEVAQERSLNAKYLQILWDRLTNDKQTGPSFLLASLRSKWRKATAKEAPLLIREITEAQKALWKFNTVGHIGRQGSPTAWMEALTPIQSQQEWRVPLAKPPTGNDITLYLSASDLGDGHDQDFIVWKEPRIEFPADDSGSARKTILLRDVRSRSGQSTDLKEQARYGLDPQQFGKHPHGSDLGETDLCFQAPDVLEVRLPAALVGGGEFITTAVLHEETGKEGSVQVQATTEKPSSGAVSLTAPILLPKDSQARKRVEAALKEFRELFPPALCYARIVPVDEVVTLTLFYREDDHLKRLMLSEKQAEELDRLWEELFFISQEPLKTVVALEQITEFATQDRPDLVDAFAPMRGPIQDRAKAFRRQQIQAEPAQVASVLQFADRAWRRPLTEADTEGLQQFYQSLRQDEIAHEEALHLLLARVLTAPAFLYKLEQPAPGKESAPVSDLELATRLSYFLWSSAPDEELRRVAQAGRLRDENTLLEQTRRMLQDVKTRRLAIQFACQWLHVRDFDQNDDKNEKLYPEFAVLRHEMYEETVRFFEDMFQNNGSILDILSADHSFLNEALAKHYGMEGVQGKDWRRIEGLQAQGRGGILGMATVLASQSGASRTSPILRGNWIHETLLGERLPRPPANVPQLPEAVPEGLTARQLIEHHSSDPACAKCHSKIDPYGFALEQFDAIGRLRPRKVDTKTTLPDGELIEGIQGLRDYLATERQDDVIRQFCRKLLGFALGRELQLSDEPLLNEMQAKLKANGFRFHVAVETIVTSPQFRNIRGRQMADD